MMPLPVDASLGHLEVVEVFDYFEEPILFSCANERGHRYVGLLSESGSEHQRWLYAPISDGRLNALREGSLATYDVFRGVEGGAVVRAELHLPTRRWSVAWVAVATVDDAELPLPGVLLELEPDEAAAPLPDVAEISRQLRRDVLAVRLKLPNRGDHSAPAVLVGAVISGLQHTLNSIGQFTLARPTGRAPIPASVLSKVQFDVSGFFGGSFGIELHAQSEADLFGDTPSVAVVEQLVQLIQATTDPAALQAKLAELSGRLPSKYKDLLLALSAVERVDLHWGSPKPGAGGRVSLSNAHVQAGISTLSTLDQRAPQEYTVVARLIGMNVRTKTYELLDETERMKYSGKIDDAAMSQASNATMNQLYCALIRETEEVSPSGEVETRYRLLGLESEAPTP